MAACLESHCDLYFQYDESVAPPDLSRLDQRVAVATFDKRNWRKYKNENRYHKTFIPGNVESSFLEFFEEHGSYAHYWFIEYDVDFTGDWLTLIAAFQQSDADLLSTTLVPYEEYPDWSLWKSVAAPAEQSIDWSKAVRGFYPVIRFTPEALRAIREALASGWVGHFEGLLATIMLHKGLSIEDIGGAGPFVSEGNENRFYTNNRLHEDLRPGSFVFRPKMPVPGTTPNTLWHPVKGEDLEVWDSTRLPAKESVTRRALKRLGAAISLTNRLKTKKTKEESEQH